MIVPVTKTNGGQTAPLSILILTHINAPPLSRSTSLALNLSQLPRALSFAPLTLYPIASLSLLHKRPLQHARVPHPRS